jgi:hypothetical protein
MPLAAGTRLGVFEILAALDHPHMMAIYGFHEKDERHFLTKGTNRCDC